MKLATVLLYWFGLLNWTDAQRSDITPRSLDGDQNHCKIFETCSECLQKAGCAWCLQEVKLVLIQLLFGKIQIERTKL